MKGKKQKRLWCLLFTVLLSTIGFVGNNETYQASDVYTNAMEFFYSTGDVDDKHIDIVDGTIYFGTRAKLAHTYASGHKYYNTLGYDVTMTGGGKSLTFSVKRGGSLMEVPDSAAYDSSGYEYLLYKIPTRKIMELAELADPANAAVVLAASEIKVRMDAIVTIRQNGVQGNIVEDGKGGITEYETNGAIYHLKNESELEKMRQIFSGHKFYSYFAIEDYLYNYKLTNYYNVGPAIVGNTVYTKGTYSGNADMLFQNGSIYNKEKNRLLQEFQLLDTGKNGLNLKYTGYHLDSGAEWKKSDGTLMSVGKTYMPKDVEPSVGFADKALVLYANWKPNTYSVEYHANGGMGSMAKTAATYDKAFELTENVFVREGYTFTGWAASENSKTVAYTDQEQVVNLTDTDGGTVHLYAVWQENIYTITLDSKTPMNKDAQTPGTKSIFEKYNIGFYKEKAGTTKISSITKPAEPGYIFEGYYSGKSGAGAHYIDASGTITVENTTFTTDKTLYAKWKPIEYTVKYNANGGKGTMNDTYAVYDTEAYLRTNTFTLTGHKFTGWALSETGAVVYEDREEILNLTTGNGKEIELFAVWEPDVYTIALNSDGAASHGTTAYYEKYGRGNYKNEVCADTISTITKPAKKGYTFGGYYTEREGQGTQYIDAGGKILSGSTTFTMHKTLYAYWIPHEYTIEYDANGGKGTMEDSPAVYDKDVTLRTCTYTNDGKTFMGWAVEKTGSVVYCDRNTVLNLTDEDQGRVVLYAVWKENVYIIDLNSDGAEDKGTEKYYERYAVGNYSDSDCTTRISTITKPWKPGYVFGGYYTAKNGAGVQYIDASGNVTAENTTFTTNKTLYAKWTITGYTIAYDANGGTGSMPDTPAVYNQTVSLSPNGFINPGKSFAGWSLEKNGEILFKDKASVRNLNTMDGEIITLYAVWEEDIYTITLNSDGAESTGTTVYYEKYSIGNYSDCDCTQSISSITKPVWTGHAFGGYWTGRDGTGDQYIDASGNITAGNTVFTTDRTLYAYWTANSYTIRYNANGGSGTMADTPAKYGESVTLRYCTFERQGYTFKGWSMKQNGTADYADRDSVKDLAYSGTVVLYAVWEPYRVQISLDHQNGTSDRDAFYEIYGSAFYSDSLFSEVITQIKKPVMTGFLFKGYFADSTGTGNPLVNESGSIAVENTAFLKDTLIFAKWTPKTYTVTLDPQGGTQGSSSVTATYKQTLPSADAPQRPGYIFKGYFTEPGGKGTGYYDRFMNAETVYTQEKDMTLYAHWTDESAPDVTLNVDNDTWTNQKVTLTAYAKDEGSGLSSVIIYKIAEDDSLIQVAGVTGLNGAKTKELAFTNEKEGVIRYKAVATDMSGNKSESYNTVYYDITAPQGTVDFKIDGTVISIELDVTDINTGN